MSRRLTIGADFLESFVSQPVPTAKPKAGAAKRAHSPTAESASPAKPSGKARTRNRATFVIDDELVNEAKNAVVALSGPPVRLTLSRLVEDGIRHELDRLKQEHHKGKPWPQRDGAHLVGGRPIGS